MKALTIWGLCIALTISLAMAAVFAFSPSTSAAIRYPITEWEHGLKTSRITATRYKPNHFGYTLEFQVHETIDLYNFDREEVGDFLELHHCNIYEGGGVPGAPAYATCDGVTDHATADKKLREVLPGLSEVMFDLANNIPVHIKLPPPKYRWPQEDPSLCKDVLGMVTSNGRDQYRLESKPTCHWVEDVESEHAIQSAEARRAELFAMLTTKKMSPAELKEAKDAGDMLNLQEMVPYNADEKKAELAQAWSQQTLIQSGAMTP